MNKTCKIVGAFLALALLAGCAQAAPEISSNTSFPTAADPAPNASFPASDDPSAAAPGNTPAALPDSEQAASDGENLNGTGSVISADPAFSETDALFWQKQAEILAARLIQYCFPTSALDGMQAEEIDGETALRLIASFVFFDGDPEDIYLQEISSVKTEDGNFYYIPIENAQKVLYQCFGISDRTVPGDDAYFDPVARTLRVPRDIGFGSTFCAENLSASFLDHNTIQVRFDLEESGLWPGAESDGEYIITLSLIQNDTAFLRFCEIRPLSQGN